MQKNKPKISSSEINTKFNIASDNNEINILDPQEKKVKLIYYTDPICSFCWSIEPQFRKFKLNYGSYMHIEYRMGGLLKSWEGFTDSNNGISCPKDVADHWEEVARMSDMSLDGDVWLKTPLSSSYPASIAYIAMLNQGEILATRYLRIVREFLFLEKRDISKDKHILDAVRKAGGDLDQFKIDLGKKNTQNAFLEDLKGCKDMQIKGFPTFIFFNKEGEEIRLTGESNYHSYVLALEESFGRNLEPVNPNFSELDILDTYQNLSTKEIAILMNQDEQKTVNNLESMADEGAIQKTQYKHGTFWRYSG